MKDAVQDTSSVTNAYFDPCSVSFFFSFFLFPVRNPNTGIPGIQVFLTER